MTSLTVPDEVPPPEHDCAQLKKAFDGWGTDEEKIISILGHRNAAQRQVIQQTYVETYGVDLLKALRKEISGSFERAVLLWTLAPIDRDALLAYEAVRKKSSKHKYVLMELACARTSHELFLVRQAYLARNKRSLEEDVAHHLTGNPRRLLLPLLTAYRYEGPEVDMLLARSEAKILHEKISEEAYYHEYVVGILSTRSKAQISATLQQYHEQFENRINKDIKLKNPKDKELAFLRGTIKCLTFPEKYFQKVLRRAMVGVGTDEESLTRVIVTQAEFSMKGIMMEYHKKYNRSLDHTIKGDTSGDYQKMLLTLIGAA